MLHLLHGKWQTDAESVGSRWYMINKDQERNMDRVHFPERTILIATVPLLARC
jgi:hypothetical protein